jgi:DNA repair protein RadC
MVLAEREAGAREDAPPVSLVCQGFRLEPGPGAYDRRNRMSSLNRVLERTQQYGVEALSTGELFTLILCGNGAANVKQREKALQLIQRILAEHSSTATILSTDVYELFAAEFDDKLAYRLAALPTTCAMRLRVRQKGINQGT